MKYNHSQNPLWHGVKIENAAQIIKNGKFEARTTQRYWPDGKRRKDTDPDYRSSFIMKGWSMTRDFVFGASWSDVVFEIDKEKLKNRFKIQPLSWNSSMNHLTDHKKESEEFVIARLTGKTFDDYQDMYEKMMDDIYEEYEKTGDRSILTDFPYDDFWGLIKAPEPKIIPMSFCSGIYIDSAMEKIYGTDNKDIEIIKSHELFKGIYDGDKLNELKNQTENHVSNIISGINIKNKMKLSR